MKFQSLHNICFSFFIAGLTGGCHSAPEKNAEIVIQENGKKSYYGTIDKDTVYAYTIKNNKGLKAVISNYGGTLLALWTPDKSGNSGNIILGYDSLAG
jgi:aldose 1-epimerase